jgi:hypothetical protein
VNNLFNLHNLPERLKFATGRIFGTQPLFFPAVILVLGIVFLIPWHMDEFIMFHRSACSYEPQKLNVYHESCLAYPINFLGLDYYRSYIHVGASSSIIFFPVFYFFASPWANYFIGIIILGLTILGLVKSLNLNIFPHRIYNYPRWWPNEIKFFVHFLDSVFD